VQNEKYGYMDREGKIVLPPICQLVLPWVDGKTSDLKPDEALWPVLVADDLWCYVDQRGKVRNLPPFKYALSFENGLARVMVSGVRAREAAGGPASSEITSPKWGFIDRAGKFVVPPLYTYCNDFSENGLAAVCVGGEVDSLDVVGGKWGYVDRAGRMVIAPKFELAGPFREGLAVVNIGMKPGDGKYLSQGAWTVKSGKWGVIDKNGRTVIPVERDPIELDGFRGGLAVAYVRLPNGYNVGFIDANGRWAVPARFDEVRPFVDGVAQVRLDNRWGLIDPRGDFVVRPAYLDMLPFSEGLAAAQEEDKRWVFVDLKGYVAFPAKFEAALSFSEGLAPVQYGPSWGYVARDGTWSIPPQFKDAEPFALGLAKVRIWHDDRCRYIDKSGRVVSEKIEASPW
jgi:hypothetical protein